MTRLTSIILGLTFVLAVVACRYGQ